MTFRTILAICIFCSLARGQEATTANWQDEVRKSAKEQSWSVAMAIVDREISRAPQDMDIRAWRARILLWAGRLQDAEKEYRELLANPAQDADNWVGLANVYFREGRSGPMEQALATAVQLDPKRADLRAAHGPRSAVSA